MSHPTIFSVCFAGQFFSEITPGINFLEYLLSLDLQK